MQFNKQVSFKKPQTYSLRLFKYDIIELLIKWFLVQVYFGHLVKMILKLVDIDRV